MNLGQLAFAAYIYRHTAYDDALAALRAQIGSKPDLTKNCTAIAVLHWLNSWKCRIREADFEIAADELAGWQTECESWMPSIKVDLLGMKESELEDVASAYANLFSRKADRRRRFQATATAKVFFVLRPNSLPPWDDAIRDGLKLDVSSQSYLKFLKRAQLELQGLKRSCDALSVEISRIPEIVNRPASTLAKLVDEYYWVTITRGFTPPDELTLTQWLAWSMAGASGDAKPLFDSLSAVLNRPDLIMTDPIAVRELREISKV